MRFYNREQELAALRSVEAASRTEARLTVVAGRRRVGKTALLREAYAVAPDVLYLFVSKKNEVLICRELSEQMSSVLGERLGTFTEFAALFRTLMDISKRKHFTLILDNFHELQKINPTALAGMQDAWDASAAGSRLNMVVCIPHLPLMERAAKGSPLPFLPRATGRITVRPFATSTVRGIMSDHAPGYTAEDLLSFYQMTGGVAKYVGQLVQRRAFTRATILNAVFSVDSPFLDEGRNVLVDEFGRDYGNYFSILSLLAAGRDDRIGIEGELGMSVGGHLERLEKEYGLVRKERPVGSSGSARASRYAIDDLFLHFWFRFIYPNRSALEVGNMAYVRSLVNRCYDAYSLVALERYFRQGLSESCGYSEVRPHWDPRGGGRIGVVAVDGIGRRLLVGDVSHRSAEVNLDALRAKAKSLTAKFPGYSVEYRGFGLDTMLGG